MASQERLALKGAISDLERKINTLRLKVKGSAVLIRNELSPYMLLNLNEIDLDQLEINSSLFVDSLKELRQREKELKELREEV